jgi:hypothetical protein
VTLFTDRLAPKLVQFDDVPLQGRPARGKIIPALKGCRILGMTTVWEIEGKTPVLEKKTRRSTSRKASAKLPSQKTKENEPVTSPTQLSMNGMLRQINGKTRIPSATKKTEPTLPATKCAVKATTPLKLNHQSQ